MQIVRIGLDLAKYVFEIHGVDAHGKTLAPAPQDRVSLSEIVARVQANVRAPIRRKSSARSTSACLGQGIEHRRRPRRRKGHAWPAAPANQRAKHSS